MTTEAPKVLALSGSLRRDSWNHRLVEVAAQGARRAGGEVTVIRLADFPLPIYDQDIEDDSGLPAEAVSLKDLFRANNGLLIASPEYNGAFSAALKNAIDWLSRPEKGHAPLDCFTDKVAGLMSCSPGALGGIRGLPMLATVLSGIGVTVLPHRLALGRIHECLGDDGMIDPADRHESVMHIGEAVTQHCARLSG